MNLDYSQKLIVIFIQPVYFTDLKYTKDLFEII